MEKEILYMELSYKIVGLAMKVHSQLGYGFLEKVNENALALLLRRDGLKVETQHPITVRFEGEIVGEYIADMLVENTILIELKVVEILHSAHKAQTLNYLKATGLRLALLMNFGPQKLDVQRVVN